MSKGNNVKTEPGRSIPGRKGKQMHIAEEHFDSIHKLLAVIGSRKNNSEMKTQHSSQTNDKSFTGTKNWDEAVSLFENGYTDVLTEIKSGFSKNLAARQSENRRRITTGVMGYAPHVPNAIQNLPNSMIYTEKQIQKVKAISIYYAPTENCGTEAKEFIQSGIAMLSAINILELSGVRVNLKVIIFNGTNGAGTEGTFATVKIKDYHEHMDVQKLCFPVVHPSLFRRFGFKWLETCPELRESGWAFGYGHHSKQFNKIIARQLRQNEYFIGLNETKKANYNPQKIISYFEK